MGYFSPIGAAFPAAYESSLPFLAVRFTHLHCPVGKQNFPSIAVCGITSTEPFHNDNVETGGKLV